MTFSRDAGRNQPTVLCRLTKIQMIKTTLSKKDKPGGFT